MKKDKALGHDPLAWIKATKEAESKKAGEVPKTEEQEASRLEEGKKSGDVGDTGVEEAKGRPSVEQPQPVRKTIETKQEKIHITPEQRYKAAKEEFIEGRGKAPFGTTRMDSSTVSRQKERQASSSIIFIIAYAVLLLILTFFVYFYLTKRMDNMSLRISNIEKELSVGFKEKSRMR